jgi:glycosyltransferase involved in cell wall biosynthesis
MILGASRELEHLWLVVGRQDAEAPLPDGARATVVPAHFRPGQPLRNARRASACVEELLTAHGAGLVHDTFGMLLPLLRRRDRHPGARFCASPYCLFNWRRRHALGDDWRWRHPLSRRGVMLALDCWLEARVLPRVDTVFLQASGLVERLRSSVPLRGQEVRILPNSVDTEFWSPESGGGPPGGEAAGPVELCYAGVVRSQRGLECMLRLAGELHRRGRAVRLTLAGIVPEHARAGLAAGRAATGLPEEAVRLAGPLPREEVRALYRRSDLMLYQTADDASPRSVLEAMACGLPVLASRHPGVEVYDQEGEALLYTEYGDSAAMLRAAERYLEDPQEQARRRRTARKLAVERFATGVIAAELAAAYRELTPAPAASCPAAEGRP